MAKKKKGAGAPKQRDFVAKHMNEFNHSRTYRDKKNDYRRNEKHRTSYDASSLSAIAVKILLDKLKFWQYTNINYKTDGQIWLGMLT